MYTMREDPSDYYDYESAKAEGWFISTIIDGMDYSFAIQKDDSNPIFSSDQEAQHFVMKKMREKSENHTDAIVFLMTHEPCAYTDTLMSWFKLELF